MPWPYPIDIGTYFQVPANVPKVLHEYLITVHHVSRYLTLYRQRFGSDNVINSSFASIESLSPVACRLTPRLCSWHRVRRSPPHDTMTLFSSSFFFPRDSYGQSSGAPVRVRPMRIEYTSSELRLAHDALEKKLRDEAQRQRRIRRGYKRNTKCDKQQQRRSLGRDLRIGAHVPSPSGSDRGGPADRWTSWPTRR